MEEVLRRANNVIATALTRSRVTRSLTMAVEPVSEQARYQALVMYHAEQLGIAIGDFQAWLARGSGTTPVAQRRLRGKERSPRAIRE